MILQGLKSKIHRATVTEANLDYEGSVTLDLELMEAAGILEYEVVNVWNITSGTRLTTYAMTPAPRGSGVICINGSAAHLAKEGDLVIITSFANFTPEELKKHKPTKVLVDANNKITQIK